MNNFLKFFFKLGINIFKYFIFILPFVVLFKTLYICWQDDMWTFIYFSQEFVSNLPFFGQVLSDYLWGDNMILSLDNIKNNQSIIRLIFAGGIGSCLGKTVFETWFSDYFKVPATVGSQGLGGELVVTKKPLILQSTNGSDLNLGSDSPNAPVKGLGSGSGSGLGSSNLPVKGSVDDMSSTGFWQVPLNTFKDEISPCFEQYTRILNKMNNKSLYYTLEVPKNNEDPNITEVSLAQNLFGVLQTHSNILNGSFSGRDGWLSELRHFLSEEDKKKIEEISKRKDKAHEDYLEKLESLGGSDIRSDLKRFFDFTNTYRNTVKKELAEADSIIKKGINDKRHPLHKKQQFRKILNTDYPKLIKSFHEEDERLKKRFTELFNTPKSKK